MTMRLQIQKHHAMTLTELLVASILVGVVITGALSADFAIRTWEKRIRERSLAQQKLLIAMEKMLKDTRLLSGEAACELSDPNCLNLTSAIANDYGLIYEYQTDDPSAPPNAIKFLCLRQDPDQQTIGDEFFVCYEQEKTAPIYQLNRDAYDNAGTQIAGESETGILQTRDSYFGKLEFTTDGKISMISLILSTYPDPELELNQLTNPKFELETAFYPSGIGQ